MSVPNAPMKKHYVDCEGCNKRMILGEPFPCGERWSGPEELEANCKAIGKPWQIEEPKADDLIPFDPKKDGFGFVPTDFFTSGEKPSEPKLTGGSASYYKLPHGATELQDLIEFKDMRFGRANIFKAMYRLGEKDAATEEYDLEKVAWFAIRRINELRIENGMVPREMPEWLS